MSHGNTMFLNMYHGIAMFLNMYYDNIVIFGHVPW